MPVGLAGGLQHPRPHGAVHPSGFEPAGGGLQQPHRVVAAAGVQVDVAHLPQHVGVQRHVAGLLGRRQGQRAVLAAAAVLLRVDAQPRRQLRGVGQARQEPQVQARRDLRGEVQKPLYMRGDLGVDRPGAQRVVQLPVRAGQRLQPLQQRQAEPARHRRQHVTRPLQPRRLPWVHAIPARPAGRGSGRARPGLLAWGPVSPAELPAPGDRGASPNCMRAASGIPSPSATASRPAS